GREQGIVLGSQRDHSTIAAVMGQVDSSRQSTREQGHKILLLTDAFHLFRRLKINAIGVDFDRFGSKRFEFADDESNQLLSAKRDPRDRVVIVEESSTVAQIPRKRVDQHLEA